MKKLSLLALGLVFTGAVSAQTTITSFNSLGDYLAAPTWDTPGNLTVSGGNLSVVGGDGTGAIFFDISSFNILGTDISFVEVAARINSGNVANGIVINFYDGSFQGVLTATLNASNFNTGGFTTAIASLSLHPLAITNSVPLAWAQVTGDGSTDTFRFSFDEIIVSSSVIPEPSTYAAIFGAMALAFVAYRRRQKAA